MSKRHTIETKRGRADKNRRQFSGGAKNEAETLSLRLSASDNALNLKTLFVSPIHQNILCGWLQNPSSLFASLFGNTQVGLISSSFSPPSVAHRSRSRKHIYKSKDSELFSSSPLLLVASRASFAKRSGSGVTDERWGLHRTPGCSSGLFWVGERKVGQGIGGYNKNYWYGCTFNEYTQYFSTKS